MSVSEIQLYNILKNKLGEKEAQTLVSFVEKQVKAEFETKKEILATKEDIYLLKQEMAKIKAELLRTVYIVGLAQFLAIVGAVLLIVNFMLK